MTAVKRYLALNYGTSRGAAMVGTFDGKSMQLKAPHRFPVRSTTMRGIRYWDFPCMVDNALNGLTEYSREYGDTLAGVGCSSWGQDFGLLDKDGNLLANPVHHDDARTRGMTERLHAAIQPRSLYQRTGAKLRRQNTLYQLYSMALANSPLLDKAVTILLMADLVSYFLSGTPVQEYTLATTSAMFDADTRDWSRDLILMAKIPPVMVPEIVAPGTVIGPLLDEVATASGLGSVPVIAPASHSLAGAVAAAPATGDDWFYIISGLYNQVGVETAEPIINDEGYGSGFSNEGAVDGNIRLYKEINGLSLLKKTTECWSKGKGDPIPLDVLLSQPMDSPALTRIINPEDPAIARAEDVPAAVNAFLRKTNQPEAVEPEHFVSLFLESLALSHRRAMEQLTAITMKRYTVAHCIGWGSGIDSLSQFTADALGVPVVAGPVEAKTLGNIIMQAMALGDIGSLAEAREIVARSFPITRFEPRDSAAWEEAYQRFLQYA